MAVDFRQTRRHRQRGVSLFGLMFWAILIGLGSVLFMKVAPTVNEYLTVKRAVEKIASGGASSVAEVRAEFDRQKEVEYAISSISGKDLEVTKEDDKLVIKFAYNREVDLFGPVYLLLKYEGRSK